MRRFIFQWVSPVLQTLLFCFATTSTSWSFTPARFLSSRDEVIGYVGGADVAAAQHTGHLDCLLAVAVPQHGPRLRNFGWEGDTVFAQPRDVGFPALTSQLQRAQVSVALLQFGRSEALNGKEKLAAFTEAYRRLILDFKPAVRNLVLVTPPGYGASASPVPNLQARQKDLEAYVAAIRGLAKSESVALIDLHTEWKKGTRNGKEDWTTDGLQLSPTGQAKMALSLTSAAGWLHSSRRRLEVTESGSWKKPDWEQLRQAALVRNRLWFDYYRPHNWAFLGGDRVSQPSSRDHRDPSRRWFPQEMEKFLPLIQEADQRVLKLGRDIR